MFIAGRAHEMMSNTLQFDLIISTVERHLWGVLKGDVELGI